MTRLRTLIVPGLALLAFARIATADERMTSVT